MTIAPGTRMTLEEFLALPEEKPYLEFVNGEVVPKAMPNSSHSPLVVEIASLFRAYVRRQKGFYVDTELRHLNVLEQRTFLPDVSLTRWTRVADRKQSPMEVMPDLTVEVLSPDDRPGRVSEKISFYLRNGVSLVWLVDPEDESVTTLRRGEEPRVLTGDDVLDAEPVLPGFSLPVGDLFAVLHEGEEHGEAS